jgi:trehalose 6-phosphate synthase
VTDNQLKIGVLSRRAPIGQHPEIGATLEHVGGLTRVLPALVEFADINWTALTAQSQVGLPKYYSLAKVSGQDYRNHIDIFLAEVDGIELNQSDWFCTNYIWPLLHDMALPEVEPTDLETILNSIESVCNSMAANCIDSTNNGYLVNDFQLSRVPVALRNLEPEKPVTFFLHTPWPKSIPSVSNAIKVLEFLATGMLSADVIQFQTQSDLQEFENFVLAHVPLELANVKLEVNPVSVEAQSLQEQLRSCKNSLELEENDISYVHIARSDPIKNTLVVIASFADVAKTYSQSQALCYLDIYLVPSRQQWPNYQDLLTEIIECVETCNSKFELFGYSPIRLHIGNDYQRAIHALARYDYLIVCSVADGLNLVAKEGAMLNNRNGVIVSTPKVGAMAELSNFCVVAADATQASITQALIEAKNLEYESRRKMSVELKRHIQHFDSSNWAQNVVANFKVLEKV